MSRGGFWQSFRSGFMGAWRMNGTLRNKWFANDDGTTDPPLELTGPGREECARYWKGDEAVFKQEFIRQTLRRRRPIAPRGIECTPQAGAETGPDWTAAYGDLRAYTLHVADVELRRELGDLLAVWHRDGLEGIAGTDGQELGPIVASFKGEVDRYQQGVRRAEDACGDDAAELQDQHNGLGTALLKRVVRCLTPAQGEAR